MTEYQIQSKNFLPETIRGYDFFSKLTEVLDYILDTYHTKNIDILKAMYDIRNSNFDAEKILALLGSSEFIQFEVDSEQMKVLCVLLSNLYEIKGTQKGLRYLLHLLDMDCKVYEWYDINKWHQQGDPAWPLEVPPCSIVLELNPGANSIGVCDKYDKWALPRQGTPEESVLGPNQAFEDTEGKFADFASRLLWICVTLNEIRWVKAFTEYVDIRDELKWVSAEIFYNKYSPYVTNCPYTLQVGHPVFQLYPYVGDPVLVGQPTYQTSPFVVRSIQEYNNPIDYDGWENIGIVGYSHQVISANPPLVGETNLTVGQPSYWAWDGVEWVLGNYLIYQHILVGQRWVEGDISEGTHRVSGCTTSILHAHKEIEHEDSYTFHKGIYVGYEHTVQEPTNPGNSYLVDTQPGDVLTEETRNDISEQVVEIDTLHEHKETEFTSNIRDLYEPFLVGDPTKFVGDTNLRVGFDYFFTHFETQKEIGFQEIFSTSCLQVGEWGHAFFPETPYPLLVGQSGVNAGSSYFVGINTYPAHYEDRNPLLFVGSALYVGSANFVSPTIYVGQGFNYVGELSPWNATDFVKDSKNVIYENLHTIFNPIVEDSVDCLDSLESSKIEHGLKSDIHDSIWTQVVGSVSPVGLGVDYIGTPGEQVGNIGFIVGAADIHVAEDQYCKLEVAKEVEISEQVLIEVPVVAGSLSDIGYSYEHPLLAGTFNVGDPHHIGEIESFVDSKIFVGQDSFGRISTGKEINIRGLFSPNLQNTFTEDIDTLDSFGDIDAENSFEEKVFAHRNLVGEGKIQNLDIVSEGDILVSPDLFVGEEGLEVSAGKPVGTLGFVVGAAELYTSPDEISQLEVAKEVEVSEQILIEAPVVGGYSYEHPLLVGLFNVGQDPFGKISTGKEINIRGLFSPNLQNTFTEDIDTLDSFGDIDAENSFEEKVFAHRNLVGEGKIQNLDIVSEGDILVSPDLFVGEAGLEVSAGKPVGTLGFVVGAAELYTSSDEISQLEVAKEVEISEQVLIEVPVVGGSLSDIGYSYEHPLLAGTFNVGDPHHIGEIESFVDSKIFVGQDSFGRISTGKEINVRSVFSYDITEDVEVYFQEQFNINEDPIPEILGGEEEDVLLHQIPGEPDPNYLAGEELVPYVWDYAFNPTNSIHSLLTYQIDGEETNFSEQFALNLTMSQEVLGGEEEDVILHEIPGETNPVYLTGEELVPYVWDPLFNPENAITAALTYHIEEDAAVPGVSWTQINPSGGMWGVESVDSLGSRVWFGTGSNQRKLFYTDDFITFNESSLSHAAGLGFTGVCAVTASLIVAVDGYNFWISNDGGVSFTRSTALTGGRRFIRKVSDSIVVVTGTRIHVINPTNGSVIRSITSPGGDITSIHMLDENTFVCGGLSGTYAAIFKTEDQFSSIAKVHEDTTGNTTGKGAIIQSDGTKLYAKMTVGTNTLVKASVDGGNTWNTISTTAIASPGWFYVHNANSSVLSNQLAVQYLSTDQHQTYSAKQTLTGNITNIFHLLPNGNLLAGTTGLAWLSVPETP